MSNDNTGNQTGGAKHTSATCPNCGYCPHCGRRDAAPMPYPHPVYPAPWIYPRYVPGPTWISQPNTTIGTGHGTTVPARSYC